MERRPRLTLLALMVCCCLCHRGADGAAAEEGAPHSLGGDAAAAQRAVEQSGSDSPYWQQANLVCWGTNEAAIPTALEPFSSVYADGSSTYVIGTADGTARAFGCGGGAAAGAPATPPLPPAGAGAVTALCRTQTGAVACWAASGDPTDPIAANAPRRPVRSLACGYDFAAAVTSGALSTVAWGARGRALDVPEPALSGVRGVVAGWWHVCVHKLTLQYYCWGDNTYGQLRGVTGPWVRTLSAARFGTCAVKPDHSGVCWGEDKAALTPPSDWGRLKLLVAGAGFSCAALEANSTVRCLTEPSKWGAPPGAGKPHWQMAAPPGLRVRQLFAGERHVCATDAKGGLVCWGDDSCQQATVPTALAGPVSWVAAADKFTCAVAAGGVARCWGRQEWGEATPPANLGPVAAVFVGPEVACAVRTNGKLRCWGNSDTVQAMPPTLGAVWRAAVAAGHVCAVREPSRRLVCWHGAGVADPIEPPSLPGRIRSLCAGPTYFCAAVSSGNVTCFGRFFGSPDPVSLSLPPDLTGADAVACGPYHACARRSQGGTVACFDVNNRDAVTTPPTDAAPAAALTAGLDFTISLSGTFGRRTAKCWGDPSSSAAAAVCAAAPSAPLSAAAAGWRHACGLLYIV